MVLKTSLQADFVSCYLLMIITNKSYISQLCFIPEFAKGFSNVRLKFIPLQTELFLRGHYVAFVASFDCLFIKLKLEPLYEKEIRKWQRRPRNILPWSQLRLFWGHGCVPLVVPAPVPASDWSAAPSAGLWLVHCPRTDHPRGHEAGPRLVPATGEHLRCHSRQWPSLTRGDNTRDHTCLAVTRRHVTRDDSQQVIASDWWHVASARAPEVLWSLDVTSADTETRVSASSQAQSLCSI